LAASFLLCLGAQGAATALVADDAAPAEAATAEPAVPALPPAIELVASAGAVEWTWIMPAADPESDAERLIDKPPQGVAPLRLGTIRFHYEGDEPAPALRIVGTVPEDLEYVDGSATGPGAEVEYDAAARQLSWTIAGPLDPGTRGLVSFRAVPAGASDLEAVEGP
jgi:hypothetical protein